ncbi:MAG: cytochrome c biogenesis protein CcsA [Candidatus Latescibacterota bacterium]|nr:MAG: cytochrome c biogenesis protein CcsA [Candidatus Latescibacterota bacterium]
MSSLITLAALVLGAGFGTVHAQHGKSGHHTHASEPRKNFLSNSTRDALALLMVQDFQGRMKPFDTLSRETAMKITKSKHFDEWQPVDFYLSIMAFPHYWLNQEVIAVRNAGVKELIGVPKTATHVKPSYLFDEANRYRLVSLVEEAHRTPNNKRTKTQRKLLSFDERVNVFFMALRGLSLRAFPLPGDANNKWIGPGDFGDELEEKIKTEYEETFNAFHHGLIDMNDADIRSGAQAIGALQFKYGADVLPSENVRGAEIQLNRLQPFIWSMVPYLIAFVLLIVAYAWRIARRQGEKYPIRHPLYAAGLLIYTGAVLFHLYGYILRWVAGGQAPLSNGYESLIFISLMTGVAGLWYELRSRQGVMAALAGLLTTVILAVSMLPTFDPAISPLVPVLASAWLIIHVTVITASYGFLGLAALVAMAILILHLFKTQGRNHLLLAVFELHKLHWTVLVTGLAFLSVGTFLGGVWANESWGRYWGWDPKETWALVTILVYAFVVHLRFVRALNRPIHIAAGSFLAIWSIAMTYFGVNYFLSGLHSYAQGDAPGVPGWVYITAVVMITLVIGAYAVDRSATRDQAPSSMKIRARAAMR